MTGRSPSIRTLIAALAISGLFLGCGAQVKKEKAPNFTLTDLNGKKFSLSDYKGKAVFIDFWATWCPPCVLSVPAVQKIDEEFKGKGLEVLGISLDEVPADVQSFVHSRGIEYRVAIADGLVQSQYGISGIPAFFLIDKNGYVVRSWGGYNPSLSDVWRKEVDKLLKE